MTYRTIGIMSGSSLDGLDIAFVEFQENAGKWTYEIKEAICDPYDSGWTDRLKNANSLSAKDYHLLHAEYGHYIGQRINEFINKFQLHFQIGLIASHGHTTFHIPEKKMTAQLGDGSAIAAETQLPVVTDLRALDISLGGQGAPIVPIGEKMLMGDYDYFLNIGGIANISVNSDPYIAFDICPANRVLNMLANDLGKPYDEDGNAAASGKVYQDLLDQLNQFEYYKKPYPKSLANDFGTDVLYPMIAKAGLKTQDALRTYVEHIVIQVEHSVTNLISDSKLPTPGSRLLVTGGGTFNKFLVNRISEQLRQHGIEVVIPDTQLVNFKEALIMAFIGVLRWRQEYNVLSSVTGAARNSIGGALWTGQDA